MQTFSALLSYFDPYSPTALYLHLPFCQAKCDYCAFYSLPCASERAINQYLSRLGAELEEALGYFKTISSVYFGGGTPNLPLVAPFVTEWANRIRSIHPKAEISAEGNLAFVTQGLLERQAHPFSRLSFGLQSFSATRRANIGRRELCNVEDQLRLLLFFREDQKRHGKPFPELNFDFIACHPGEKSGDTLSDIKSFFSWMRDNQFTFPEHLSLYCTQVESCTPLERAVKSGTLQPLGADEEADELEKCWGYLKELGYSHYEVSSFCLSGCECHHNLAYWTLSQYCGLGCAAAGRAFPRVLDDKVSGWETYQEPSVESWNKGAPFSGYSVSPLSPGEVATEMLAVGLRTTKGVDLSSLFSRTGRTYSNLPSGPYSEEAFRLGRLALKEERDLLLADTHVLALL